MSEDGELRDTLGRLTAVFEMPESAFFRHYATEAQLPLTYAEAWQRLDAELRENFPELPFSNPWIAQQLAPQLPTGSSLYVGILNSLRSWNLFPLPEGIQTSSNVGGFGIDGCVSTVLGASLASPEKLFFVAVGDLAFFYDLNALGNRHLGKNLRILLVNNASGSEFHMYSHPASRFGEDANAYMAADGHFGNASRELVKHYAEDLGLTYLTADSKEAFHDAVKQFLAPSDRSILLECFTRPQDESDAHERINTLALTQNTFGGKVSKLLPTGLKAIFKK